MADYMEKSEGYIDASKWVIKTPQGFQQENNSDCGILACQFVKHMMFHDQIPEWEQGDGERLRILMAWEMLEKHIRV